LTAWDKTVGRCDLTATGHAHSRSIIDKFAVAPVGVIQFAA
jgi:hypothetical protein